MTTTFRRAIARDADAVRRISAAAYVPAYEAAIGAVPKPALEDYRPHIEQGEVWMLETKHDAVGVLVLHLGPAHMMVYSVAVDPRYQGHGFARALLELADRRAIAAGVGELRLYTNVRMKRNVSLYEGCGFVEAGRRPHPSRDGEILMDMVKTISGDAAARGDCA